jgi:uncharacterized protein YjbJ (UPF0337 family)
MNKDQKDGIKDQLKGWGNTVIGTITGNEDQKVQGDVQITNGANQKDYGDQKDNIEKGIDDPGNPSNE